MVSDGERVKWGIGEALAIDDDKILLSLDLLTQYVNMCENTFIGTKRRRDKRLTVYCLGAGYR